VSRRTPRTATGRDLVPGCEEGDLRLMFVRMSNLKSDDQENTAAGWIYRTNDRGWTICYDLKPAFGPRAAEAVARISVACS